MSGIIKTNNNLCTGCNRCVRECPMELANITYQDESGDIKVRINPEMCISCGHCISACKHKARYYMDDTERFFADLERGIKISIIAAPSIRTNLPMWRRLFTYLKNQGVDKIYDVSLGADICIWGHLKYLEKNPDFKLITQPCPVIVSYLEIYQPELIKALSPVHSPMACTAIYMKEYEDISSPIAALSPCIGKADEFSETNLCEYNVTFASIREYLMKNRIKLPAEQSEFDHYKSGLGVLFPLPGGLKENIAYFLGNKVSIDTAEGVSIFNLLNIYGETPKEILPHVFDVLNCAGGCNAGTACSYFPNFFEINRTFNKCREQAIYERGHTYYENLYKQYDEQFDLDKFLRNYTPRLINYPQVSDYDIDLAFKSMHKNDFAAQNIDCGACGNETCYNMARKIAMKVNIPVNCIVKSINDAKDLSCLS
ncbi:MAG: 4Fe-4S dicluster domain-containing protein [Lachnospiraceae bacterium]|nr:4Fe-4S dicluster domain-containing protein [Lachnospiraceae bacterium]